MKLDKVVLAVLLAGAVLFAGGCGQSHNSSVSPTTPPQEDSSPPLPPSGLDAPRSGIHADGFLLHWTANAEPDLSGYRIYLYDPNPNRLEAYRLLNGELVRENSYEYFGIMSQPVTLRITAVDEGGAESAMSEPLTVSASTGQGRQPITQGPNSGDPRGASVPPTDTGHDRDTSLFPGDLAP